MRGTDPVDRLRSPLRLTEQGRRLIGKSDPFEAGTLMERGLQAIGADKAARLNELLKGLLQNLSPQEDLVRQVLDNLTGSATEPNNRKE